MSHVLDTYEKIVVAKQIRHLSKNQEILFSNQNRMMEHLQSTQKLNEFRFRNITKTMVEYREVMRRLWLQVVWSEEQLNRLGRNIRLLHAFHLYDLSTVFIYRHWSIFVGLWMIGRVQSKPWSKEKYLKH